MFGPRWVRYHRRPRHAERADDPAEIEAMGCGEGQRLVLARFIPATMIWFVVGRLAGAPARRNA
jgi:hypothetical protein